MLKTLSTKSAEPKKGVVGVDDSSRARRDGGRSRIDDGKVDGNEIEDNKVEKKVQKLSKSKNLSKSKKTVGSDFLTSRAKLVFTKLRQVFFKAPILHYFDLERYIRIETDASGYAINKVLYQLTLDDLGWWNPVVFFSQKMIPAKTKYKTYDVELLAIVEAFKTWKHYLEGSHHKILVFTDHNNLKQFMDTKSLSSRQVC